jgi:hypothetical protein
MSPPFLATLEGEEVVARTAEPVSPKFANPTEQRTWVREQLRSHGLDPNSIETIKGDCELQTDTQILDGLIVLHSQVWN